MVTEGFYILLFIVVSCAERRSLAADSRQCSRCVLSKMEKVLKTGYRENTFGYEGYIAENELAILSVQQLVEYDKVTDAGGGHHFDSGEINYHVTNAFFGDDVIDAL
jgi:hypothetical protein